MKIDLLDWLKYIGLTFAAGFVLAMLSLFWTWCIARFLEAKKATLDARATMMLAPHFRAWVRKYIYQYPEFQKHFPKDKYPDYYESEVL